MTNRNWVFPALVLAALLAANAVLGWQVHVFLGRKLIDLIHWMAFWR